MSETPDNPTSTIAPAPSHAPGEARRTRLVSAAALGALVVAAIVLRKPLVAWFTGASTGGPASPAAHVTASGLSIDVALQPDPPRESGNHAHVVVRDAQGQPVTGAKVRLEYDMPAMGAMPAMHGGGDATEDRDGGYTVAFDLGMGGSWTILIRVTTASASANARYTLRVGAPGLTPLTSEQEQADVIHVEDSRRALLGIRTAKVTRTPIDLTVTAKGRLAVDETRLHEVTLRVGGYISDLRVNATGQSVSRGDTLFTLYSPELYAAEQEYLIARQNQDALHAGSDATHGDRLVRAAETKLRLWGLSDDQLAAIVRLGEPIERVPFKSPASGVVIEKAVVDGAAVTMGQRLFRIADLDDIWVEADVYESDLPRIKTGLPASITLDYLPGKTFDGKVAFVYPYLDPASRTGRVRIALPNKGLELKPDMYATVTFKLPLGPRLVVPISSVVYTGPRRLVFVDLGHGALRPQEVTIGARSGDVVEIASGLQEGDTVISSGNFLVAAESRVRSAGSLWEDSHDAPH